MVQIFFNNIDQLQPFFSFLKFKRFLHNKTMYTTGTTTPITASRGNPVAIAIAEYNIYYYGHENQCTMIYNDNINYHYE